MALRDSFDRHATDDLIAIRDRAAAVIDQRARQQSLFDPPRPAAPPQTSLFIVPALTPAFEPNMDIATVLSPSQVNTFVHDCQMKWYYRKVLKLPEAQDVNRALGKAVHHALAENFKQKIESEEDLPLTEVLAIFLPRLDIELADVQLGEEKIEDLQQLGAILIEVYLTEAAPSIQPVEVEGRVSGEIGGVKAQGYFDVLDAEGNIYDIKTAKKKPSGVRADYRTQVTTYAMLEPRASGRTTLHTITKTKTVVLHPQTIDVTEGDRKHATKLYQIAQEGMRAGIYTPNRASMLCSQKYCSFWKTCVEEFGGEVNP
jgi:hypothetical protein